MREGGGEELEEEEEGEKEGEGEEREMKRRKDCERTDSNEVYRTVVLRIEDKIIQEQE